MTQREPQRLVKRFDSPWSTVVVAALAYGWFVVTLLSGARFDPSHFVVAGDLFCDAREAPASLRTIEKRSSGYDGQFYYRLSVDPFTRAKKEHGIEIDAPPYRHQRILYPLLTWVLSGFGRQQAVPWALIGTNLLGLLVIAYAASAIMKRAGRHALWGLLVALYPGFLFTLRADLTEITEASMLVLAVHELQRRRQGSGVLFLSLAVLAKEVALLAPATALALFVWERVRRDRRDRTIHWTTWCVPLLVFCAWQGVLRLVWGQFPMSAAQQLNGTPFTAVVAFVARVIPPRNLTHRNWTTELIYQGILAVFAIATARRSPLPGWMRLGALAYLVLGLALNKDIWLEDTGFMRALAEFATLALLSVGATEATGKALLLSLTTATWVVVAIRLF